MLRNSLLCLIALEIIITINAQNPALPSGCYESNYTSNHTRCDLSFLFCFSRRILQSCYLKKCQRYVRGTDCYLEVSFVLDQSSCYSSCCGSSTFDEASCNQYNMQEQKKQQAVQTALIVVLVLISVGLIVFVVWYSTRHMRCCQKSEPFKLIRFNIKWHKDSYVDSKCDQCRTFGPLLVTPCKHFFHVSCFEEATKEMVCPKCHEQIKDRIKIYCFHCRQRSFKVRLYRVQDIAQAIAEGKGLHYDLCPKQIKTNRKLITQSEEHL